MDLRKLSNVAHMGPWVVKNKTETGSDIYVGGNSINSGFVGCFRSNSPLPKHLARRLAYDSEFVCALVNAYREGRLVEVQPKDEESKDG
jgi:hypothetical protein